jgi:hypothetical protein
MVNSSICLCGFDAQEDMAATKPIRLQQAFTSWLPRSCLFHIRSWQLASLEFMHGMIFIKIAKMLPV